MGTKSVAPSADMKRLPSDELRGWRTVAAKECRETVNSESLLMNNSLRLLLENDDAVSTPKALAGCCKTNSGDPLVVNGARVGVLKDADGIFVDTDRNRSVWSSGREGRARAVVEEMLL